MNQYIMGCHEGLVHVAGYPIFARLPTTTKCSALGFRRGANLQCLSQEFQ